MILTSKSDLNILIKDIGKLNKHLKHITPFMLAGVLKNVAKAYANKYNNILLKEGHPNLAKAKCIGGRLISGVAFGKIGTFDVMVSIPKKAYFYDEAEPHFVSIKRNRTRLINWIKRKWIYSDKSGWRGTKTIFSLSKLWGNKINPKGSLFVTSHKTRFGWKISDRAEESAIKRLEREIIETTGVRGRFYKQIMKSLKTNYNITYLVKIGGR